MHVFPPTIAGAIVEIRPINPDSSGDRIEITPAGSSRLKLKWQERGGPQVAQPTRQGFGTTLLRAVFPDARFDYAMEGFNCEIDVLLTTSEPDAGSLSFANE